MNRQILFIIFLTAFCAYGSAVTELSKAVAQETDSVVEESEYETDIGMEFVDGSEAPPEQQSTPQTETPKPKPTQKIQEPDTESKGRGLRNFFTGRHKTDPEEIEDNYQKALRYYNRQQMKKAQKAFEKIDRQYPDYKDTRRYLTVINDEAQRKEKMAADESYRQEVLASEAKKEEWRKDVEKKVEDDSLEQERKAEQAYKDARVLYDQKDFEKAREKFEFVDRIIPDYRQTSAFLKSIERKTAEVLIDVDNEPPFQPAKENPVKITELPAIQLQSAETVAAQDEDVWDMEISDVAVPLEGIVVEDAAVEEEYVQNREEPRTPFVDEVTQEESDSLAEPLYEAALDLFNSEKYDDAEKKFWEVQAVNPEYKAVATYLKKIEEARKEDEVRVLDDQARQFSHQLRAERLAEKISADKEKRISKEMAKAQRKELENLYREAKEDYGRKDYAAAKPKFEQVASRESGYRSVNRYLQKIDAMMPPEPKQKRLNIPSDMDLAGVDSGIQEAVKSRREQLVQITQEKYNQAMAFYKNKNYPEAKYKFIEVEAMAPNYKETRSYLTKLEGAVSQVPSELTLLPPVKTSKKISKVAEPEETDSSGKGQEPAVKRLFGKKKKDTQVAVESVEVDLQVVEQLYQDALASYGSGDYALAQEQFEDLQDLRKGYKDSSNYLRLSRKMAKQEEKERLRDIKQLAKKNKSAAEIISDEKPSIAAVEEEAPAEKKSGFGRLFGKKAKEEPPASEQQIVKASEDKVMSMEVVPTGDAADEPPQPLMQDQDKLQVDEAKVEAAYQEAIALYDRGDYSGAQDRFELIKEVHPGYKETNNYLKKSKNMASGEEKERVKEVKQLAKATKAAEPKPEVRVEKPAKDEPVETQTEKKSGLGRLKFWKKSPKQKEEVAAVAPTPEEKTKNEQEMAKIKEDISTREAEDAERIAKLERRHKRELAEKQGLPIDGDVSDKKSDSMLSKVFDRTERDATLDQRRRDLEKMVIERRKVLQGERSKIQKEFEKSLDDLYGKAVKMNDAGLTQQAYKVFVEIDRLQPGYKETQKYLAQITQMTAPQKSRVAVPAASKAEVSRDDIISSTLDQFEKGM